MVFKWLPVSVADLTNLEAREKMLVAACLAGMSFGNSQVALAHSLGHSMGSVLRLHHGLSVGMALPYTIEFNCTDNDQCASQYAELARMIGITLKDGVKASLKYAEAIRNLMGVVGSPRSFSEAGVKKKDFKAGLEKLVEFAMMDSSLTMNPRNTDSNEIRKIYEYMYDGKVIDF